MFLVESIILLQMLVSGFLTEITLLSFLFTNNDLDYCCTNYYKTRVVNCYKGVLKLVKFFPTDKNNYLVQK